MSKQDYDRVNLLKEVAGSFNSSELSELAFNLDIDYEDLAGSNRRAKARELITYCERRGLLEELIVALGEMRENVDWYAVAALKAPGQVETVRESQANEASESDEGNGTAGQKEGSPVFETPSVLKVRSPGDSVEKLKVFLSYASEDRPTVRQLFDQLLADGFDPWLDAVKLLPGMKWNEEIEIAVEESHVVVVCLSKASVSKEGYVQKEIGDVLEQAARMTEGTIFLIPARLQECSLPRKLRDYQAVDLFVPGGYERLVQSLQRRQQQLASRG